MGELHLTRIDLEDPVDVAIALEERSVGEYLVRPQQALADGGRYRLWVDGEGECATPPVEFEAIAASPLPDSLGRATTTTPVHGDVIVLGTAGYGCTTRVPAVSVDPGIDLSEEAAPWGPLFEYTLEVDGFSWSGASRVFVKCGEPTSVGSGEPSNPGAGEGNHSLRWRATLPGVERVLTSEENRFAFYCEGNPPIGPFIDVMPPKEDSPSTSDCAAAHAGSGRAGASAGWPLALLAALLLQRRR